ncbi:hypothetical protein V5N11_029438 [Cardamine amara subsp. amara]|uniref:DUF4218 domain-containing protein n=1 Tax=Cardamine amara subsp. amara TaxID=228776 RepID=A0ABD1C169_CARAN
MNVEKNFFENIMNIVLNVQGKTKDNMKSRLDLAYICDRDFLEVLTDGKCLIPPFRLDAAKKEDFFHWIHDDRLLPFAFGHLLHEDVHKAIAGVGSFFRDLCTRTLTVEGIDNLKANIPVILCDLEKIFPPSFFDVMEHLPIHLPEDAALEGPVQYPLQENWRGTDGLFRRKSVGIGIFRRISDGFVRQFYLVGNGKSVGKPSEFPTDFRRKILIRNLSEIRRYSGSGKSSEIRRYPCSGKPSENRRNPFSGKPSGIRRFAGSGMPSEIRRNIFRR